LQQHLVALPRADIHQGELDEEDRALLEAMTSLKLSRIPKLLTARDGKREDMDKLLGKLDKSLKNFNRLISDKHFEHRKESQQLVNATWDSQ
jgi:hypothetical protein